MPITRRQPQSDALGTVWMQHASPEKAKSLVHMVRRLLADDYRASIEKKISRESRRFGMTISSPFSRIVLPETTQLLPES